MRPAQKIRYNEERCCWVEKLNKMDWMPWCERCTLYPCSVEYSREGSRRQKVFKDNTSRLNPCRCILMCDPNAPANHGPWITRKDVSTSWASVCLWKLSIGQCKVSLGGILEAQRSHCVNLYLKSENESALCADLHDFSDSRNSLIWFLEIPWRVSRQSLEVYWKQPGAPPHFNTATALSEMNCKIEISKSRHTVEEQHLIPISYWGSTRCTSRGWRDTKITWLRISPSSSPIFTVLGSVLLINIINWPPVKGCGQLSPTRGTCNVYLTGDELHAHNPQQQVETVPFWGRKSCLDWWEWLIPGLSNLKTQQ